MDPQRFDRLAKTLSDSGTRRGLLRLLAAVPVAGGVFTLLEPESVQGDGSVAWVSGRGGTRGRRQARHLRAARHRHDPGQHKENAKDKRKRKRKDEDTDIGGGCVAVCAGKPCGAANECGGICACPTGQECLPQGVCATPCRDNPGVCSGTGCGACYPAQNGQSYCAELQFVDSCDEDHTCRFPGLLCVVGRDLCAVICNP